MRLKVTEIKTYLTTPDSWNMPNLRFTVLRIKVILSYQESCLTTWWDLKPHA